MTRCLVIGTKNHAAQTARMLATSAVPAAEVELDPACPDLALAACRTLTPEVIAVFICDLPDGRTAFLRELKECANAHARVHVLKEAEASDEPTPEDLASIQLDDVTCAATIAPFAAASALKRRWFPNPGSAAAAPSRVIVGLGLAEDVAPVRRRTSSPPAGASSATEARKPKKSLAAAANSGSSAEPGRVLTSLADLARNPVDKKNERAPEALQEPPPPEEAVDVVGPSAFTQMRDKIERNSPLPLDPVTVPVVGMHGKTVELDPRRVKPLPNQPRWANNPGFTEESLRGLGESMRLAGQVQDVLVRPLVGDPDHDAELIDGERRQRGAKLAKIMLRAKVREDVTHENASALWFLSVVRNNGGEPPTTLELVYQVARLRSPEFGQTMQEVAASIGVSVQTVHRLSVLMKLDPDVRALLDDGKKAEKDDSGEKSTRRLTSQLGLLLVELPAYLQKSLAHTIIDKGMNYNEARRFVLGARRDAGVPQKENRRGWRAERFGALVTLTKRNVDAYGIFLDMPQSERLEMVAHRNTLEREEAGNQLTKLIDSLTRLREEIQPPVAKKS